MSIKKSKTYFLCAILASVSFLTQISAVRAGDIDDVVVTGEILQVTVDLAKQELAGATLCDDVSSIDASLEKIERIEDTADYVQLIRSLVSSPIEKVKFKKSAGWSRIGIVQRLESLRTLDLALDPHASDYYTLLPEGLDVSNPNLEYYQWLSQVVYVVHACLQNKSADVKTLQAGYRAYFSKGVSGFEWLLAAPAFFEEIHKHLQNEEGQENQYVCLSPLYKQTQSVLLADLEDRVTLECSHPIRGTCQFSVFNTKRGADTLLSAFGLSYDESLQILVDAVKDKRFFQKDRLGLYDNLNRRLYRAKGGEAFVKQQMVLFLNHYTASAEPDSLVWISALLKGMAHVGDASVENDGLKSKHKQQLIDHEAKAPYLTEIGNKPEGEAELLRWNEQLAEWKKTHQSEFDAWESERVSFSKAYDNEHFMLRYKSVLSGVDQTPENLIEFIREDFANFFQREYMDLDPFDSFGSMAYTQPLLTFAVRNLFHWRLGGNSSGDGVQITSEWNYILSPILQDLNVLKTVGEDGQVHYLKLVVPNDYVGLAKAIRAERALGLTKVSALTQYGVSKSEPVVSGDN